MCDWCCCGNGNDSDEGLNEILLKQGLGSDESDTEVTRGSSTKVKVEVEGGELFTGALSRWTIKCSDAESLTAAVVKKIWKKDGDDIACDAAVRAAVEAGEREVELLYDRGVTMVRVSEDYAGWIRNPTELRVCGWICLTQ